ncbi:MAG: sugar transferase, partial [Haloferacaceae archaeon]
MDRALVVGDDVDQIERIVVENDLPFVGYLAPTSVLSTAPPTADASAVSDGGTVGGVPRLGGLSRLDGVLVDRDIDLVVLAFGRADRGEFFGALETCFDHGVDVRVHPDFEHSVLVSGGGGGDELVEVELQPWDPQDYALKRAFDVAFAGVGLLALSPVMLVIAVAIKLDDGGSILY